MGDQASYEFESEYGLVDNKQWMENEVKRINSDSTRQAFIKERLGLICIIANNPDTDSN